MTEEDISADSPKLPRHLEDANSSNIPLPLYTPHHTYIAWLHISHDENSPEHHRNARKIKESIESAARQLDIQIDDLRNPN